jgi:hypothetical protein
MVCQLRPLVYSLGLNNLPRICLTPRKSRLKNLWRNKQGNCLCKMAGAGIRSFAKFRSQMPRIATTGIASWQTALKWTAECQPPLANILGKIWPRNATDRTVPLLNFPRNATSRATVLSPWHSAVHIWARNLAKDWTPAPAILHQEPPCLLRHKFLTRDFPGVSPIHGELSLHSISWHYPFKNVDLVSSSIWENMKNADLFVTGRHARCRHRICWECWPNVVIHLRGCGQCWPVQPLLTNSAPAHLNKCNIWVSC